MSRVTSSKNSTKRYTRMMELRLTGNCFDPKAVRDFGVVHPIDVMQDEHTSPPLRKLSNCPFERKINERAVSATMAPLKIFCRFCRSNVTEEGGCASVVGAQEHHGRVNCDSMEPGTESGIPTKAVQLSKYLEEDVLREILRVGDVVGQAQAQPKDIVPMLQVNCAKSDGVPFLGSLNQFVGSPLTRSSSSTLSMHGLSLDIARLERHLNTQTIQA